MWEFLWTTISTLTDLEFFLFKFYYFYNSFFSKITLKYNIYYC